ncbi:hypothetical protein RH831_03195 [Halodesulfurarchaeum sp. HSR-GB]|uniref:hypothetical protein n=1 Tax=Halodesulfurarchaeum sp. HSR-GB TaxID=3074077 RepID=UPI00285C2565|nr:hypothetical protein [Halodesulfurarchaeum sp. HSR-GB]MDR5656184.1 hypothetical protein [Halodesulfurarchaeum sp. HSR-GB]
MSQTPVFVTRPLLAVLLELAADASPESVTVSLSATAAADLDPQSAPAERAKSDGPVRRLDDLEPDTPVFSDFYFPDVGNALEFVFGVDLGTPAGQTQARFLSHPDGNPELSMRDDLHATVLVAVPPWEPANVVAFGRNGTERSLVTVAAAAPETDFDADY